MLALAKRLRGVLNSRLRDELLNVEVFTCLAEARVLAADWRADYNANHPHSALGMMSQPDSLPAGSESATRTSQSTPDIHSGWTDEWGPVILGRAR